MKTDSESRTCLITFSLRLPSNPLSRSCEPLKARSRRQKSGKGSASQTPVNRSVQTRTLRALPLPADCSPRKQCSARPSKSSTSLVCFAGADAVLPVEESDNPRTAQPLCREQRASFRFSDRRPKNPPALKPHFPVSAAILQST